MSTTTIEATTHHHRMKARPDEAAALPLIAELLEALDAAEVTYCHFKSNDVLERSASGENDLDLLVSRTDGSRFVEVLHGLGFKQATPSPEKRLPGVIDFYGYDFRAARFVHVHAHFQLIVGHDATKNYCLPLERAYLESDRRVGGFRTPAPEIEFIVLVIRLILKHATWDAILVLQGRLTRSEQNELRYLRDRVDMIDVRGLLESRVPFVGVELFERCLQVVEGGVSLLGRVHIGQALRRSLRPYARRGQWSDAGMKILRRATLGVRRKVLGLGRRKPRLSHGGIMIAVVGGDGAGKSTAVDGMVHWLSTVLDVRRLHLGKPPRSVPTRIVQLTRTASGLVLDTIGRQKRVGKAGRTSDLTPMADGSMKRKARLSRMIWEVSVARDRHRAFAKARRFSMNGGLVVCDRFPLPDVIRLMDAPRVEATVPSDQRSWLIRRLCRLENGWYQGIVPPELLIVLRLDPDIAVSRKTDEGAAYVRMRSQEVWQADFDCTDAVVVDASMPRDELLAKLKEVIWARV